MAYVFDGAPIARRRRAKGLTQARLAARAKTNPGHLSRLEHSKYVPSVVVLANLAEAIGLTPETLLVECLRKLK